MSETVGAPHYAIENRDGQWWYQAPPPHWHREHRWQTRGWVGLNYVERCACGAFGDGRGHWDYLDAPRLLSLRASILARAAELRSGARS